MDPVPLERQTWSTFNYIAFWISDAANPAVWEVASSMLAIGLSWRQVLPAVALGHVIVAVIMVLNGTTGARLHVPFPVLNRSSFGFWLSYFSVVSRVVLSMFWYGIQTYTGSECVYQMLKAIWPSIAHVRNRLPESAHITTVNMMCYFIYWLIQFPFMLVSPHRVQWLFTVKALIVPPAWLAMLIWAMVRVPPSEGLLSQHASIDGSQLSWAWLSAMNSVLGLYSTYTVNIPDFTRYARTERVQNIQMVVIPVAFTLCCFVGLAVTSAGTVLYGEVLWDPLRLVDRWDNRTAAFFAAFAFALSVLGTNVSANSLAAGIDMSALCPRYINIRRGQVVCAFLGGWALCPWEILATASGFLAFMSGYSVFLGPIAAIMVTDYWLVHRTKVDVPSMYRPRGRYYYTGGVNWRAAAALIVSIPPNMPGLIHSINDAVLIGNVGFIFDVGYLFGFFVASGVYGALSTLFPAQETVLERAIYDDEGVEGDEKDDDSVEKADPGLKEGFEVHITEMRV